MDIRIIDQLAARLGELLPAGAGEARQEIEGQVKAVLKTAFDKMDLVTREEFDAQKAVLERAMVKLEALQRQLDDLETG